MAHNFGLQNKEKPVVDLSFDFKKQTQVLVYEFRRGS